MSDVEAVRPQRKHKVYTTTYWLTVSGQAMADASTLRDHVILGPAPCQGCGAALYWRGLGLGWCEAGLRARHRCG